MLPHTNENINLLVDFYDGLRAEHTFWVFVSRIDLIEETSDISYPGIPNDMKSIWGNDFFFDRDEIKDVRDDVACGVGTPLGILVDSTRDERRAACTNLF